MSGAGPGQQPPLPPGPAQPGGPEILPQGPQAPPGMPPGAGGLLSPALQSTRPGPMPQIPGLMRPVGQPPTQSQVYATLTQAPSEYDTEDDPDNSLPALLRPFAAGLRPAEPMPGAGWQQEIIYGKLGKSDDEIAAVARHYLQSAEQYDNALQPQRTEANDYYRGAPLGGEEKGRSQLVLTVVRDTIRATLPSLLRVFTAVEDPISFEPSSNEIAGDDKLATTLSRQATDYCRWALFTANPGWRILHDVLLEALTRKAGWVRWHWGKRQSIRTEVCEGLLLPQLRMILQDKGVEAQRIVRRACTQGELQALAKVPEAAMMLAQGMPAEMWSATITRSAAQSWPIVESIPANCVWVVPDADTVEGAKGIFHVRNVTASDLIEMGFPEERVLRHAGTSIWPRQRTEAVSRNPAQGYNLGNASPPSDRSMGLVRYAEGWVRCDADNDHRAELLHVHMLGDGGDLVRWERTDEIPLACFTPYREPGAVIGMSQADMVMDLQRTESRVMRSVLDSLSQSIFPRTAIVLGQVNMADVRQTAIGSIIRTTQAGAVTELVKPFAGKEALPVMDVLEAVRESRTGITRASQGLSLDQLQSTAPVAVSQQTSAAQDRLDMMARTLAETGLAPLYSGLLKMMARQQDRPNVIRLRGAWISIDPRALATMWETTVNVGGKGMPMERLAMLGQVAMKQEQMIMQGGLQNPLAGIPELRNTYARMLETVGIGDVSSYFKPLPPGWQPPAPTPPPPDPSLILAQVQGQKTSADIEAQRAEEQTKRADMLSQDDRERKKTGVQAWVQAYGIAAQHGVPIPALAEFMDPMASAIPQVALLPGGPMSSPPPSSPIPPAVGGPQKALQAPPGPMQGQMPPRPPQGPMLPPQAPRGLGPSNAVGDPAARMAVQQGLQGRGPPTAYGQIANRAALSSMFGPGGPSLPRPGGQGVAGAPGA